MKLETLIEDSTIVPDNMITDAIINGVSSQDICMKKLVA